MSVRESDHAARSQRDSATRAPYGRVRPGAADGPEPAWQGQTYYDRPAVKPSLYGWRIILYFFLGREK